MSQPHLSKEEAGRDESTVPTYDFYILSEFEEDSTDTIPNKYVDSTFASKINVNLQRSGFVTFYRKRRMPLNQLSHFISASKFILLIINESLISKFTYDRDLCDEFDYAVSTHRVENIIILVEQEMKDSWTGRVREFAPTEVFFWSETIRDYEQLVEELAARFGDFPLSRSKLAEKSKLNAEKIREKINGRIESIISLLSSTQELLTMLQSEESSKFSIHFLDVDGHSVVTTYFFVFFNQFTVNFQSKEDFFVEITSNDLKDMRNKSFSAPLIQAFHLYKEILYCSGGDYGQLQIDGSLLDYFETNIYAPREDVGEEETLANLISRLQSSSPTREFHLPIKTKTMSTSATTLKKLKYFLIKGIFLILYYELNLLYQAWEFLLFQVVSDMNPGELVLESLTSCSVEDYQTEFVVQSFFF